MTVHHFNYFLAWYRPTGSHDREQREATTTPSMPGASRIIQRYSREQSSIRKIYLKDVAAMRRSEPVADRLLPILRRACRRKFPTFGKANDRTRLIRLVDEVRASMDFKNPDYVVVRVARRRKRVAVRFQQMRAKFFRKIRSKRFRIVPLANVAFVYRLAWMQIRGQHVFPKILLKQKRKMTALVGRA